MPEAPICKPDVAVPEENVIALIIGLVKVLFVNVSEPANVAKLSLCNAVLNSAKEPVKVFDPKSIVLFVNVSVVALPTNVSVALKNVTTLSAVGSTNAKVVSYSSAVAPSNTKAFAPDKTVPEISILPVNVPLKVPPSIVGLVRLLFVSVSEPVNDTKLSLCKALFHSANEPVKVLLAKSIVLLVNVSVVALPISVSVALKNVIVLSAVGSVNARVVHMHLP